MNLPIRLTSQLADLSMSSREIAELCEKRHDHVMRDIKKMLGGLGEAAPKFGGSYLGSDGTQRPCFNLPKDLTLTLVAGYNVVLRKRIIDRWLELEQRAYEANATELTAQDRSAIGGIVKACVGVVLREQLHALIPELIEPMLAARLSERNLMIRRGKTAKQIWDAAGLPPGIKGITIWFGNRLAEMGCMSGRADRGDTDTRLFDPDRAAICLKNGLLHKSEVYASERMGQGRFKLVTP